jgi:hypothetical protein
MPLLGALELRGPSGLLCVGMREPGYSPCEEQVEDDSGWKRQLSSTAETLQVTGSPTGGGWPP